jgi:hypothetical protein
MPAGRPSEYNFELCAEICEHVASGMSIRKALEQSNQYPTWETFRKWRRDNEELMALYTWARQDKSESVEFQYDNTIAKLENGEIDPMTARVILDALKWKMAKYYPKMFGDKTAVDLTSGGDKITWNEVKTYNKE